MDFLGVGNPKIDLIPIDDVGDRGRILLSVFASLIESVVLIGNAKDTCDSHTKKGIGDRHDGDDLEIKGMNGRLLIEFAFHRLIPWLP